MICNKEPYGFDRDNDRGIYIWDCEIDNTDKPDIVAQIEEAIQSGDIDDANSALQITLVNPHNEEEIQFEINPIDYITQNEFNILYRKTYEE